MRAPATFLRAKNGHKPTYTYYSVKHQPFAMVWDTKDGGGCVFPMKNVLDVAKFVGKT